MTHKRKEFKMKTIVTLLTITIMILTIWTYFIQTQLDVVTKGTALALSEIVKMIVVEPEAPKALRIPKALKVPTAPTIL